MRMTVPAYCTTCRTYYKVKENPPYAVMHIIAEPQKNLSSVKVEVVEHRHPITGELLEEI